MGCPGDKGLCDPIFFKLLGVLGVCGLKWDMVGQMVLPVSSWLPCQGPVWISWSKDTRRWETALWTVNAAGVEWNLGSQDSRSSRRKVMMSSGTHVSKFRPTEAVTRNSSSSPWYFSASRQVFWDGQIGRSETWPRLRLQLRCTQARCPRRVWSVFGVEVVEGVALPVVFPGFLVPGLFNWPAGHSVS